MFRFTNRLPYDLLMGVVYEYTCGCTCHTCINKPHLSTYYCSSYYIETERHVKVRSSKHMGISSLPFKKTRPCKESLTRDHLLQCDNKTSFDELTILTHGIKKYLLQIKESLLIKSDQPVLNKNISSAKLHLFDTV